MLSKNHDVVNKGAPSDGVNPFDAPGLQYSPAKESAGMKATNSTEPEIMGGSVKKSSQNLFKGAVKTG
jgi:hypothetical protein